MTEDFCITFDDGVELVIEDVAPAVIRDFLLYQGFDATLSSEDGAEYITGWFRLRGCRMHFQTDDRVLYPWRFVCRYRAWRLNRLMGIGGRRSPP